MTAPPVIVRNANQLHVRRLPAWAAPVIALLAAVVGYVVVNATAIGGPALSVVIAVILFIAGVYTAATLVEGRRRAKNRVATTLVWSAFVLALLPLVSVAWTLVSKGWTKFTPYFWQHSMNAIGPRDDAGGAYHAIVGTLEQAGIATLITVPLGVAGAVYIVEYGRG